MQKSPNRPLCEAWLVNTYILSVDQLLTLVSGPVNPWTSESGPDMILLRPFPELEVWVCESHHSAICEWNLGYGEHLGLREYKRLYSLDVPVQ